jgi:hypothetical protein
MLSHFGSPLIFPTNSLRLTLKLFSHSFHFQRCFLKIFLCILCLSQPTVTTQIWLTISVLHGDLCNKVSRNELKICPWAESFFRKLTVAHLVKIFPAFYGTRMFITVFSTFLGGSYTGTDESSRYQTFLCMFKKLWTARNKTKSTSCF